MALLFELLCFITQNTYKFWRPFSSNQLVHVWCYGYLPLKKWTNAALVGKCLKKIQKPPLVLAMQQICIGVTLEFQCYFNDLSEKLCGVLFRNLFLCVAQISSFWVLYVTLESPSLLSASPQSLPPGSLRSEKAVGVSPPGPGSCFYTEKISMTRITMMVWSLP